MRAALLLAASLVGVALSGAPAKVQAQAATGDGLPSTQRGMGFTKDPSGARITEVVAGSPAEHAGVTEGMVITHIDGLPLRELTTGQIARIFAGARTRLELKVRGGGTLTVNDGGLFENAGSAVRLGTDVY